MTRKTLMIKRKEILNQIIDLESKYGAYPFEPMNKFDRFTYDDLHAMLRDVDKQLEELSV